MTSQITDLVLDMIDTKYPHLTGLTGRYRLLEALYPEALYEFDDKLRKRGLRREDVLEDSDLVFLKNNVKLIEDELESASRQIQAILTAEQP